MAGAYYKLHYINSEKLIRKFCEQTVPISMATLGDPSLHRKMCAMASYSWHLPRMKDRWAALEKALGWPINHFRAFEHRTAVWGFQFIHCKIAYVVIVYFSHKGLSFECPPQMVNNANAVKSFVTLMHRLLRDGLWKGK